MISGSRGFSLVQLLIVVSIFVIVAAQSMGSYTTQLQAVHLKGALQSLYFQFQKARHHAVAHQQSVVIDINEGKQWCIGVTDLADCDCLVPNSCTLKSIETIVSHQQFSFTELAASSFAFDNQTRFSPPRGFPDGYAGALTLVNAQQQFKLILSNTGRLRICTLTPPAAPYKKC